MEMMQVVPGVSVPRSEERCSPDLLKTLAWGLGGLSAHQTAVAIQQAIVDLARALSGAARVQFIAAADCAACLDEPSTSQPRGWPATVVAQACRSRDIVSIKDVGARHTFAHDPYLQQANPGSLLCVPIWREAAPLGALYLEEIGAPTDDPSALFAALAILAASAATALDHLALREHMLRENDIRRKAESELAFKQNLLRALVDNIPIRIYAKDRDSRFLFGNDQMARLAGVETPAQLYGKTDLEFFPAELANKYIRDEQTVLQSGQSLLNYEELVENQDTGELGWTVTTKVLLRNQAGEVDGIVGIGWDVTQRKRMEARLVERGDALEHANATLLEEKAQQAVLIHQLGEMQGQLLQSEKMASIGVLAAGVAHEINNPLAFVSANFRALQGDALKMLDLIASYEAIETLLPAAARAPITRQKQDIGLDDIRLDMNDLLNESAEGLKRVKDIVQNLKDFSRVGSSTNELANLETGLDSTLNIVWNEIKYKADVRKEYAGIPEVSCLPSHINQVFLNLLVNAAHAIEGKGQIIVRTGFDDDNVWVEIEDDGSGIAPQHLDRIFEPFFTTKPVGKGTGLGLSIAYGIMKNHGGSIEVANVSGGGTRFKMKLPRAAALAPPDR